MLTTQFVDDLYAEWKRSGSAALRRLANENPAAFVRAVGNVLPRELSAELNVNIGLFQDIEDFNACYRLALAHIGSELEPDEPKLIEAKANGHK